MDGYFDSTPFVIILYGHWLIPTLTSRGISSPIMNQISSSNAQHPSFSPLSTSKDFLQPMGVLSKPIFNP